MTARPDLPRDDPDTRNRFLQRLRSDTPLTAVELRPPRSGLTRGGAMDTWIDLSHSIRGLVARDAFLLLTDSAVGQEEEENLQHLTANLAGEVDSWRIVPFLTCKHPLDYCLRYGDRAGAYGVESLTVVGGDKSGPPARCVPHAYLLRNRLRQRLPRLALGGWVNLHGPAEEQLAFVQDPGYDADYYLTQVVSHHDLRVVEDWLAGVEAANREAAGAEPVNREAASEQAAVVESAAIQIPGVFGVFYYRNGKRESLERLSRYFPVPVEAVAREFESGVIPEEHCARTIRALRSLGISNVYVCNLGAHHAAARYDRILAELAD